MDAGIGKTISGKLITFQEDAGGYITYVFENMNYTNIYDQYVMCVRFPNWNCCFPSIGDIGYLKYREVEAGEDKWYDSATGTFIPYKYSDIHFLNFIPIKERLNNIVV